MRIVHVVDAAQAQAHVQQRFAPPPIVTPPRRVQAVNRHGGPDDPSGVGTSPPDDGISLDLSPEAREAARQAMLDELRASQAKKPLFEADEAKDPAPDQEAEDKRKHAVIQEMELRDREVRTHEQAHAAAAGGLGSAPIFTYQVGPDGRLYAVGGEVQIDTSPVAGDPEATLRKAHQIEQAAFAPGDPSPEDRRAAVMAAAMASRARQELARQQEDERQGQQPELVHHVSQNG